jgi:hypothetical protein
VEDARTGQQHAVKVFRRASALRGELELYAHLGAAPRHVVLHRGVVPTSALLLEDGVPSDLVQGFFKLVPGSKERVPMQACSTALVMELGQASGFRRAYDFQVGAGPLSLPGCLIQCLS